jgi:hypothetical protein
LVKEKLEANRLLIFIRHCRFVQGIEFHQMEPESLIYFEGKLRKAEGALVSARQDWSASNEYWKHGVRIDSMLTYRRLVGEVH